MVVKVVNVLGGVAAADDRSIVALLVVGPVVGEGEGEFDVSETGEGEVEFGEVEFDVGEAGEGEAIEVAFGDVVLLWLSGAVVELLSAPVGTESVALVSPVGVLSVVGRLLVTIDVMVAFAVDVSRSLVVSVDTVVVWLTLVSLRLLTEVLPCDEASLVVVVSRVKSGPLVGSAEGAAVLVLADVGRVADVVKLSEAVAGTVDDWALPMVKSWQVRQEVIKTIRYNSIVSTPSAILPWTESLFEMSGLKGGKELFVVRSPDYLGEWIYRAGAVSSPCTLR